MVNNVLWKTYTDVGCTSYAEGNYRLAQKMFEAALREAEKLKSNDAIVGSTLRNLALACVMLGDHNRARRLFRRALTISEKLFGRTNLHAVDNLENLAEIHFLEGDFEKSKFFYKRSLKVLERMHGDVHPALIGRLARVAWLDCAMGKTSDAMSYLQRAQEIKEKQAVPATGPEDELFAIHPSFRAVNIQAS